MTALLPRLIATSLLILSLITIPSQADSSDKKQHDMQNHASMNHGQMAHENQPKYPTEPGQGAFATIAEIVAILVNDHSTDWSKVNIAGLREHLIDMNEVTLRAKVTKTIADGKIIFNIVGTGRTRQAIQAMVPVHSNVLARTTPWDIKGTVTKDGAIMVITTDDPTKLAMINGLGFFGIMATGAHHQAHHFAMAKGDAHIHGNH